MLDLRSIRGSANYRRFVIVGAARSGSTLLTSLLNDHSQALAFGEIFRDQDAIGWDIPPFVDFQAPNLLALYRSDPVAFLQQKVFRRWPRSYGAVGFKLFYYHARTPVHAAVWTHLAADDNLSIVHIKRRDLLDQYYSLQLAHKTDVWSIWHPPAEKPPAIHLDVQAFREYVAWIREGEEECERLFQAHTIRDLYYEDLVAEQEQEMGKIQKFLGLRREKLSTKTMRQRIRPLGELITNYEELKQAFPHTARADCVRIQTG
jgi:LPS sulfotransferase NodH